MLNYVINVLTNNNLSIHVKKQRQLFMRDDLIQFDTINSFNARNSGIIKILEEIVLLVPDIRSHPSATIDPFSIPRRGRRDLEHAKIERSKEDIKGGKNGN